MVKIRLQRRGRRKQPFYHIVIADSRSPRDGRFIAKVGTYNPMTKPATIDLDRDAAFEWLQKGAQPTDTVRAILRAKGVLYRKHLQRGVSKGALTQEQADEKYLKWIEEKEASFQAGFEQTAKEREAYRQKVAGKAPVIEEPAPEVEETPAADAAADAVDGDVAEDSNLQEGVSEETVEEIVAETDSPEAAEAVAEAAASNPEMQSAVDKAANRAAEDEQLEG